MLALFSNFCFDACNDLLYVKITALESNVIFYQPLTRNFFIFANTYLVTVLLHLLLLIYLKDAFVIVNLFKGCVRRCIIHAYSFLSVSLSVNFCSCLFCMNDLLSDYFFSLLYLAV